MASERQTAANRRNAKKSTGPRSASGKKRSSQNAHRHGLTKPVSSADFGEQLENLARQIAGDLDDIATLALARVAAEAQLQLSRVKQVKKSLIERAMSLAGSTAPATFDRRQRKCGGSLLRSIGAKAPAEAGPLRQLC